MMTTELTTYTTKNLEKAKVTNAAIKAWANATTDSTSPRRKDLLRDKTKAVDAFFTFAGKAPNLVTPADVQGWQDNLESQGLSPATVYAKISRVSSFYNWARKDSSLAQILTINPVDLARPKAPKPFQSESTKALGDSELMALVDVVRTKAESRGLVGLRDYALLLHFLLTGRRRAEVLGLRWGNIKTNGVMVISYRVKGGEVETRIVQDPTVKDSMLDYLKTSGRLETIQDTDPIWTRHDQAGESGAPLTSHAFVKNLKHYAKEAGIESFHLHQLRHSYARIAGDESGSISAVQEALGHKSQATTKVYLQRVGFRRDQFSSRIAERLGMTVS